MSETNTIEFYKALAKALEEKSKTEKFSEDSTFTLNIFDKDFVVGPFKKIYCSGFMSEDNFYFDEEIGFSFEGDDFAITFHDGAFDSWGEHEYPYVSGIRCGVTELVKTVKVFKRIYI